MEGTLKALIVDDNEINAMLAAEVLDSCGMPTVTADSGREAIDVIRNGNYCFVLMDYIMPEMDGLEATKRIREFSNVPIYAMSGDMDDKLREKFADAGANGMVSKPFKLDEISALCDEYKQTADMSEQEAAGEADSATGGSPSDADGHNEENSSSEVLKDELKESLMKVYGLNYESGLTNSLNNEKNYSRVLSASIKNISKYIAGLKEYPGNMSDEDLKIATHSLAGVFANIGIDDLRVISKNFEKRVIAVLEEGAEKIPEEEIKEYIEKVESRTEQLEDAIDYYEGRVRASQRESYYAAPECELKEDEMKEVVDYVLKALDRFEVDYIVEGLNILKKAFAGEERRKIETALEAANEFDYETVRMLLSEVTT